MTALVRVYLLAISSFVVGVLSTILFYSVHKTLKMDPIIEALPTCQRDIKHFWKYKMNITKIIENETLLFESLHSKYISPGGHFDPHTVYKCSALQNIALIIPYRKRSEDLKKFIPYIHNFMQRQRLKYTIYLIEQTQGKIFNKASLFTVGFVEAAKAKKFDCYIFHDVDTLPADDRNHYGCGPFPIHPLTGIDFTHFGAVGITVGGVLSFTPSAFRAVNGFSNKFRGWGGEDNEMWQRITNSHLAVVRPTPKEVGFYCTIGGKSHGWSGKSDRSFLEENDNITKHSEKTFRTDGLNDLQYDVSSLSREPYYTRILVEV